MSFLRQFSVICVHMHISEWYCQGCWTTFLCCILFTLFLANTCVLIPATSTPSAGGHRQLPSPFFSWTSTSSSPCFSTYSCLTNGPHLAETEGLQQTHSPSSGDNQAFPHSQITGGMNVCLYVSHDLSLSLSTGFLGHSPLCALHSPSLSAALPSSSWFILWRHCSAHESFKEGLKGAS